MFHFAKKSVLREQRMKQDRYQIELLAVSVFKAMSVSKWLRTLFPVYQINKRKCTFQPPDNYCFREFKSERVSETGGSNSKEALRAGSTPNTSHNNLP